MTSVNVEQSQLSRWVLGLLIVSMSMLSTQLYAAPATIELFSTGGGSDTTAKLTASTDSHTYQLNLNNPTDNTAATYTPTASVSYQVTSSVFNSVRYNSAANPATSPNLVFGGGVTTAADPLNSFVSPNPVYVPLNTIGGATDTAFAATLQNGNTCPVTGNCASTNGGISAANNYGARLLIATRGLNAGGVPTNTGATPGQLGTKVGTVVITFNRPVTNPIVHVAGWGGASTVGGNTLGFSGQLQLTGSTHATGGGGAVLSRIAGSAELSVRNGTDILNVATNPRATTGAGGASGSVLVTGRRINTLTFDVYIRGNGGLAQWSEQGGEAFFLGASSIEADNDLSIVKSQRIGTSGTFVQSQINGTQFDLIQYRLVLTNNSTIKAVSGAQLTDTLPASLTNTSLVSTNTTGTGTSCTPTLTGNTLTGTFSGPAGATCTVIVQGYASTVGTVTNTATVLENSTDPNTANNSSSVNAIISAPATISPDPTINEARFTIVPDLPTIYRGGTGTQLVTITNNGPSNATGTIATFIPAPQTGVSVTAVSVVGGGACTFAAGEWSCPVGNVANGANFQLDVTYSTTSASALGTAQQATIKVRSNEFNPGSGVGETLYKVWGSNQTNEIRPNGAFWVGYTGTGGSAQVGANSDENTPIINAWPAGQASPTGAYLASDSIGARNAVYGASSSTASPMIQRIVTNMLTDPNRTVDLPQVPAGTAGDNRRAWEYRTGVYVPTAQTVTLCIGNTTLGIDDNAYIMVDGVVQGTQDNFVAGGFVSANLNLSAGYHSLTYRIVNQNIYSGGAETSAGGYGQIGISLGGTCNTANFDVWTNTAVPASINIVDGADLQITKTNSVTSVDAGGTTAYSVVVTNAGPSAANGAFFRDAVATGLTKTTITCTAAGGASCPASPISIATVEGAPGLAITTLPSGGSVTFTVTANVTATSGSVANTATITVPSGVTELNATNNNATDTDTVTPVADLSISKSNAATTVTAGSSTTYTVVVTNNGPSAANGALFQDAAVAGLNKTSVSCTASGGASCPVGVTAGQIEAGVAITTLPSGGSVTFTVTANVTATSGSVVNTATITAPSGTTDNATGNNSATDTDTVNGTVTITGLVFTDNGGSVGASAAYNGVQNAGERGIGSSEIRLTNCSGTVVASSSSAASGEFVFSLNIAQVPAPNFCLEQTNLPGYVSVSGSSGYTRATDSIQVSNTAALSYGGHRFGDVQPSLVLTHDGQSTVAAGSTATYAHTLSSETPLTVTVAATGSPQPSSGVWSQLTYLDSNCNGQVDSGETLLSGSLNLLPGNPVCLIDRVNSPLTAAASSQYLVSYIATGTASVQDGGTITASSAERRDLTLVGSPQGALLMEKKVRTVASCPSTGSDVASFVTSNTAKNGQRLEYQIIYRNAGNANLSQVVVRDSVPATTRFGSASCTSTPGGNSCSITQQPAAGGSGDLRWQVDGSIKPGQSGEVRFCVDLPALP